MLNDYLQVCFLHLNYAIRRTEAVKPTIGLQYIFYLCNFVES